MNPIVALTAEPPDQTQDVGPWHRGGPFALFVALFCVFAAAGTFLLSWRQGYRIGAGIGAAIFGAAALWAIWCVMDRFRHHGALPHSHSILTSALAFDIQNTCRDVAATVFFLPDHAGPGAATQLWCFLENYASRRRVARFCIGPHAGLDLREEHRVSLELAAGQAAVYLLPLRIAPTLGSGEHDLPITLRVDKITGAGVRLPGTKKHLYDLWTIHFAAPFTVDCDPPGSPVRPAPLETAHYLSLASVSEPESRIGVLHTLLSEAPERSGPSS